MTPQELLNADLGSVGRWLRQGLAWWVQELADLVPARFRRARSRSAPWLAEMTTETGPIRLWRDGAPAGPLMAADGQARSVDLLAPPGAVLTQDLDLPRLSAQDLNRLLHLNIDRFTPFRAEQVYFDTEIASRIGDGSKQRVRLGVMARDRAKTLLARADAMGLTVERLGVGAGDDGRTLQFDFMRAIRVETGEDRPGRRRAWLWGACAALLAANVLVAVLRDMNEVSQLERRVDAQRPTVALATRLRQAVQSEQGRRVTLLTRRSVHEPLRILDAATRALPAGQWVQRLEWNGRAARLVGFRQTGFDVLTALHGPALRNPRSLLSDMPAKAANNQVPFDVMADAAVGSPR